MKRVEKARATVRRHVWAQLASRGGLPASKVADTDLGDTVVLDVDATLVTVHSEKESAAATFKGGFGYHPIGVWCDNTQEMLAAMLRPGNAGSNTTADHITVLTAAIAQVPAAYRKRLLVRADGAGASHGLLEWLTAQDAKRGRSLEYSVGFAVTDHVRTAIEQVPPGRGCQRSTPPVTSATAGTSSRSPTCSTRDHHPLAGRDAGHRPPGTTHPGAQLSLFEEADGWRYQAVATNTRTGQLAFLEARHRAHARVEDRIRHAEDSGLGRFPSREFAINQAWLQVVTLAADLTAWLRLLALPDTLKTCEPKALRYRLLHVPARLTRSGRQRRLRIPRSWPWAAQLKAVFDSITAIPAPT